MKNTCATCRQPTADLDCALCENTICEPCNLAPPTGSFSLLKSIPEALSHKIYCRFCFDEKVEPELMKYEEIKSKADEVYVFFKTQRKEIPLIKKSREVFEVTDCDDRDETILRLAFMAAEQNFNAVIETDVIHKKVRNHAYQSTRWQGTGIPAMVDEAKLDRQHKRDLIYR